MDEMSQFAPLVAQLACAAMKIDVSSCGFGEAKITGSDSSLTSEIELTEFDLQLQITPPLVALTCNDP